MWIFLCIYICKYVYEWYEILLIHHQMIWYILIWGNLIRICGIWYVFVIDSILFLSIGSCYSLSNDFYLKIFYVSHRIYMNLLIVHIYLKMILFVLFIIKSWNFINSIYSYSLVIYSLIYYYSWYYFICYVLHIHQRLNEYSF